MRGLIGESMLSTATPTAGLIGESLADSLTSLAAMVLFTRKSRFAPTHVLLAGVALTTMSQSIIALATANGGAYAFLLRSLTLGSTYLISPGIADRKSTRLNSSH